jgi:hypothetical protein
MAWNENPNNRKAYPKNGEEKMPENEIDQSILDNAVGPKSAESDGQKVEQHSLKDQIEADRYLNAKKAMKNKNFGLKIGRIIPPGAG